MANTLTPEEAAKVRELESQLDFLKVQKTPEEPVKAQPAEAPQAPQAAQNGTTTPSLPSHNALLADGHESQPQNTQHSNAQDSKASAPQDTQSAAAQDTSKALEASTAAPTKSLGGMSALDRARASRFAPPKHILQQASAENAGAQKKEEKTEAPKEAEDKKDNNERPKPEGPKPVSPKPVNPQPAPPKPAGPQPALKLAMTVEEAKKQGLIAPGTYGKPEDNEAALKGDTKEIPNIAGPVPVNPAPEKEADKAKAHPAEPIKNPLPVPKKHIAREMDFDLEVAPADMHFDVVDMSGIDYFDIN